MVSGRARDKLIISLILNYMLHLGMTEQLQSKNKMALKVADIDGVAINGAVVTFKDALGNSDIWLASGATYSTAMNSTDVTSTLTGILTGHCLASAILSA